MAFVAECLFCGSKVRAPDGAAGLSVPCPRCGNSFTLAAKRPPPATAPAIFGFRETKAAEAPLAGLAGTRTPAVLSPQTPAAREQAAISEDYVRKALGPDQLLPAGSEGTHGGPDAPGSRPLHLPGVLSLLLGSFALVASQIPALVVLSLPLAGAGLVLGVVSALTYRSGARSGWLVTLGGSVVSLAVLAVLVVAPHLLGLESLWAHGAVDQEERHAEYAFQGPINRAQEAAATEWVDARKHFIQHGVVRVRVESATLRTVEFQDGKARRVTRDRKLVIRLRLIATRPSPQARYESWGLNGQHIPRLQDSAGRAIALTTFAAGAEVVGQLQTATVLLPGKTVKDVLVFEAPEGRVDYVRLELPATAIGGTGTLRLQLARSMIEER